MNNHAKATSTPVLNWVLGIPVFIIGLLFIFLVHPVPGIIAILISLIYLPQASVLLQRRFGFPVPLAVKILLAIAVIWFTLGVSDLGDIFDKWMNSL
ncbi:MAG: hypothetical protein K0Q66_1868 [Chitinophagaceae bacterium]|nr:hypothetical protein [Chitinophagaceae bacterium]